MITTPEEYLANLILIGDKNIPVQSLTIPSTEEIYNIDLNTRKINAPKFLSTQYDHYAETIYFKCERYFDSMDLSQTVCVINYINKNAKDEQGNAVFGHLYAVPFIDISTEPGKILIPWCISGDATKYSGTVTFSFCFYQLSAEEPKKIIYMLNTMPSSSEVLHGMELNETLEGDIENASEYLNLIERINSIENQYKAGLYWIEASELEEKE